MLEYQPPPPLSSPPTTLTTPVGQHAEPSFFSCIPPTYTPAPPKAARASGPMSMRTRHARLSPIAFSESQTQEEPPDKSTIVVPPFTVSPRYIPAELLTLPFPERDIRKGASATFGPANALPSTRLPSPPTDIVPEPRGLNVPCALMTCRHPLPNTSMLPRVICIGLP